jgi:signal transduction histidine kinase
MISERDAPLVTGSPRRASRRAVVEDAASRWPLARIIGVAMLTVVLVLVVAIALGAVTLRALNTSRDRVVNKIDPAALHGSQLYAAMLNQETGLRGYLLSGQRPFLSPYASGVAGERTQVAALRPLIAGTPGAERDLSTALTRIAVWRARYAEPAIATVAATGKPMPGASVTVGKVEFDSVRAPLAEFQRALAGQRTAAVAELQSSARALDSIEIASAVALLLVMIALGVSLRAAAITPLARLAGDARRVSDGDFGHEVDPSGPREVHTLAVDVDRMRERILRELSAIRDANVALEARAREFEQSNAELEQFAYVASHDLQEPLRQVASFCQLLQNRYSGQLDSRANQYIDYAVDAARRGQDRINGLLALSRVGRHDRDVSPVSCARALSQARGDLGSEIRSAGVVIETAELPAVRADPSLLTSLFQNLLSNAIRFRSDRPPFIQISADYTREDFWRFSVADNGIGVEPEYADHIFGIFQRLHDRKAYPGTGIGLAMCRRIVEHYGGRIWLDTDYQDGAKFVFTLPGPPPTSEEQTNE